jgi:hypothetical protein
MATSQMNQRIPNGQPEHAAVLFESMFGMAQADIRIFTGLLDPRAYAQPGLSKAAKDFVCRRNTSVRILFQKPPQAGGWLRRQPLIESVLDRNGHLPDNFQMRLATGEYAKSDRHFAVMDQRGYRYEIDHDKCKAFANFNEPDVANKLAMSFDEAFASANPVELQ